MFIEYVIFGIIDNVVMLTGALFGISIEKKFPKKLQTGFLGATLGAGLLLTHVIFHPVQKSANRLIQIVYTLRIRVG